MQYDRRSFLCAAGVGAAGLAFPSIVGRNPVPVAGREAMPVAAAQTTSSPDRSPLLQRAFAALDAHGGRLARRDVMGVVDFSKHSSKTRFQLIDIEGGRVAASYLVAHGRGSDPDHSGFLESFSNVSGSNATSRGSYLVANTYYGKYGRSRRLDGLDPENSLALDRAIVLHGASYVSAGLIEQQGKIGRSYGCFSVAEDKIGDVLDRLGEGCLLYADRV